MKDRDFDDLFLNHIGIKRGAQQDSKKKKESEVLKKAAVDPAAMKAAILSSMARAEKKEDPQAVRKLASVARKKSTQQSRPAEEVDLHMLTKDAAEKQLHNALARAMREGTKRLLVVTGKGIHSESGPVLKPFVADYLKKHSAVKSFSTAPRTMGGTGAYMVELI